MIYGLDYLGGVKFGNVILREHPQGWAAGFFTSTFGDALPLVSQLLATGRCPLVRLHLLWKDDHGFTARDFPAIQKEARRVAPLVKRFPNVQFYVSGACEHKLNASDALKLSQIVQAACPGAIYVNTPLPQGAVVPGLINEAHGSNAKPRSNPYAFSFDGSSAEDSDVESTKATFSQAPYFMLWSPRFNGRWEDNDPTPRPQRKGWPDPTFIESIVYLARARGAVSLPKGWIWKSHSENKGKGDPRAEKPVLISNVKAPEALLKARNGQVVHSLKYYGTIGNQYRYYASDWGFHIAEKARRIQGDALTDLVINGKKFGVINAAYRGGAFR